MTGTRARDLVLGAAVGLAALASLVPMSAVFVAPDWVRPTVVSVLVGLAVAASTRAARLSPGLVLLAQLLALAVTTTALHLPSASLLPGVEDLRALRDLAEQGAAALRDEAAPADPLPGLVLLVATGAWAVTVAAHDLAVRLRTPGIALLPLATIWVVPLAMPQPEAPSVLLALPFLAASALVLLLASDADLVGWTRAAGTPRITTPGVAIAVGAIAVGLVAPWLLPGLGQPPLLDVGTGRNPRGYQPFVDIGDRLQLPVDRPVLRVRTERRVYLRLAALDTYDGDSWDVGPPGSTSFTPGEGELFSTRDPLPFETPIADGVTAVVDVEVLDLENIFVPTPYQPVEVTGPGADSMVWSRVGGFLATGERSRNELGGTLRTGVVPGFEYGIVARIPAPTIDQLRAAEPTGGDLDQWRQLPGDPSRWEPYAALAEQVWADTGATSAADRALDLQDWFTDDGGFVYSLSDIDRLSGANALETFLFDTRTGYCEYFATAMAVMLRASGIPARVAVGFLPGDRIVTAAPDAADQRDTYQVSTGDAHAWVEVLFPGQGWITFDPTPRADGATLTPDEDDLAPDVPVAERPEEDAAEGATEDGGTADAPFPDTPSIPELQDPLADPGAGTDGTTSDDDVLVPVGVRWALGLALVLAVAAALAGRRARPSAGAGAAAALAAQQRVLDEGERLGIGRRPHETATEVLHRWAGEERLDAARAAELASIAQRAAFAADDADVDGARAQLLAEETVEQLRASVARTARALAPVRTPVSRGVEGARRLVGRDDTPEWHDG